MISGVDHCYRAEQSTGRGGGLPESHFDEPGIVTIDLGFNDLRQCLAQTTVDEDCVTPSSTRSPTLPYILTTLKAAAGPDVTFVGLGHYDPYLADAIHRSWGVAFARRATWSLRSLMRHSATSTPMRTSRWPTSLATSTPTDSRVHLRGVGDVSGEVARNCELTWMCAAALRPQRPPQ